MEMMMANKKGNLPPASSYSYVTLRRGRDGILMDVTPYVSQHNVRSKPPRWRLLSCKETLHCSF